MSVIYAIGDIHGRDELLERLYARIEGDPHRCSDSGRPLVIHLGDYVDGGPQSDKFWIASSVAQQVSIALLCWGTMRP